MKIRNEELVINLYFGKEKPEQCFENSEWHYVCDKHVRLERLSDVNQTIDALSDVEKHRFRYAVLDVELSEEDGASYEDNRVFDLRKKERLSDDERYYMLWDAVSKNTFLDFEDYIFAIDVIDKETDEVTLLGESNYLTSLVRKLRNTNLLGKYFQVKFRIYYDDDVDFIRYHFEEDFTDPDEITDEVIVRFLCEAYEFINDGALDEEYEQLLFSTDKEGMMKEVFDLISGNHDDRGLRFLHPMTEDELREDASQLFERIPEEHSYFIEEDVRKVNSEEVEKFKEYKKRGITKARNQEEALYFMKRDMNREKKEAGLLMTYDEMMSMILSNPGSGIAYDGLKESGALITRAAWAYGIYLYAGIKEDGEATIYMVDGKSDIREIYKPNFAEQNAEDWYLQDVF